MNQHVTRPAKSERTPLGLKLTEPQPLSGIPAVWRFAALVSTLVMGALALIGALYLGRTILLPVVAGIVVGITLTPVVKFGTRFRLPTPVSALLVVILAVAVIGLVVTFFAAPLTEWIARAPEIGAAVQQKLRVFEYPLSVLQWNSRTPVANREPNEAGHAVGAHALKLHLRRCAGPAVLERVQDEVPEDLRDPLRLTDHRWQHGWHAHLGSVELATAREISEDSVHQLPQ